MNGAVIVGNRSIEIRQFADPSPGTGQVVVRTCASGMGAGGREAKLWNADPADYHSPSVIAGHEGSGVVVAIGEGVTNVAVDDRVIVYPYRGCERCVNCVDGWVQLCSRVNSYGTDAHGSWADFQLVEARMLVPLPVELSFEEGAVCADSGSTAYEALGRLGLVGGQWLLVYGIGAIGAATTAIAAASGVRVVAIEADSSRRSLATRLGAEVTVPVDESVTETLRSITDGRGVDAAIDTRVTDSSSLACLNSLRNWGTYCITGEGTLGISIDLVTPIKRELTIIGSWGARIGSLLRVARSAVDQGIPLSTLVSHRFRLADAAKAFELYESQSTAKVLLTWPDLEQNQSRSSGSALDDRPDAQPLSRASSPAEVDSRLGATST